MAAERRERLARMLDELTDEELEGFLRGSRALRLARERLHARSPTDAPPRNAPPPCRRDRREPRPEPRPGGLPMIAILRTYLRALPVAARCS